MRSPREARPCHSLALSSPHVTFSQSRWSRLAWNRLWWHVPTAGLLPSRRLILSMEPRADSVSPAPAYLSSAWLSLGVVVSPPWRPVRRAGGRLPPVRCKVVGKIVVWMLTAARGRQDTGQSLVKEAEIIRWNLRWNPGASSPALASIPQQKHTTHLQ